VIRRIFHSKLGSADELIKICADTSFMGRGLGIAVKPKVLSDLNGGRTDRVVVEWELEDLSEATAVGSEWDEGVDSRRICRLG